MKTTDSIPTGKLKRAGKILKTSLKVGRNYASYYGERLVNSDVSKEKLNSKNASDIMKSLYELKGGGLKIAQMLSMEENLLPQAYTDIFSLAQFSVPPLSAPLVKKTFVKYFGATPDSVFDKFNYKSKFAASIGQVHEAWKDGVKLAVKIQYPGVGASIQSDLAMLKPLASRIMNLNLQDADKYFREVETKLIDETDYNLELENSIELSTACAEMTDMIFPKYMSDYSNERIITMEWIEGIHLSEWLKTKRATPKLRNKIAQQLWDFYMFQIHNLHKVHADPHPGNVIITPAERLAIIDFGCVKELPSSFYRPYASLLDQEVLENDEVYEDLLRQIEILYKDDSDREKEYFKNIFTEMLELALIPYRTETFDFGNKKFFKDLAAIGERMSKEVLTSEFKPNRGSKHMIYVNRTLFGLYSLLHNLKGTVITRLQIPEMELA